METQVSLVLKGNNSILGLFYGAGLLYSLSYSPLTLNEQLKTLERLYSIAFEWEMEISKRTRQLNADFCGKLITAMEYNLAINKLKSDENLKFTNLVIREIPIS